MGWKIALVRMAKGTRGVGPLGDGYRIEARITVKELQQALVIPNSSLVRHRPEWHVFKVLDGRAVLQKVTVGVRNEALAEVLSGLAEDDQVVVYPSDNPSPGVLVRPLESADSAK